MVHKSSLLDQNPGATASADALMGLVVPPAFCDHVIYSLCPSYHQVNNIQMGSLYLEKWVGVFIACRKNFAIAID
jgi:hypothetical protein